MGTHPIFESDFDCLTDKKSKSAEMAKVPQKSKEAKAKAASGGGKKSKKKWSKGKSRDKLQNMCLFDKPTYDRVLKEVPNYKVITPSIVSDRMKIRGSLARRAIKELCELKKIKLLVQHSSQMVYPRAIAVDDDAEEEEVKTTKKGGGGKKKAKKRRSPAEE